MLLEEELFIEEDPENHSSLSEGIPLKEGHESCDATEQNQR